MDARVNANRNIGNYNNNLQRFSLFAHRMSATEECNKTSSLYFAIQPAAAE